MNLNTKQGFTLLELLVVIFIIGALSALLLPNFMSSRERARDTQRKNDLKQIQTAMEIFKQDQSPITYAEVLPTPGICWSSGADCSGNIYMKKFPSDPNGSTATPKPYYYAVDNANLTFNLYACIENIADLDTVACPEDFLSQTGYSCSSTRCFKLQEP